MHLYTCGCVPVRVCIFVSMCACCGGFQNHDKQQNKLRDEFESKVSCAVWGTYLRRTGVVEGVRCGYAVSATAL